MEYAAIPTRYRDIQFRSRLEAKWAVVFDLLGWRWEYEPFDLNGWIPDFMLLGKRDTLVEIKPVRHLADAAAACKKVEAVNPKQEVLLLGYDGFTHGYKGVCYDDLTTFGWFYSDTYGEGDERSWGPALVTSDGGLLGFTCDDWFHDRMTGACDKGLTRLHTELRLHINRCWATATNLTQWKAPSLPPR